MGAKTTKRKLDEEARRLLRRKDSLATETAVGQMVADRQLARNLVEYGLRTQTPEAVVLGADILSKTPVVPANASAKKRAHQEANQLLKRALRMRPADRSLAAYVRRVRSSAVQNETGIDAHPKMWVVKIDRGKHYRLKPDPVFPAQVQARVTAWVNGNPALGITVRRFDQKRVRRYVGQGKVIGTWNPGIKTTKWDVRLYNLSGPDALQVQIVTS